MCCCLVLVYRRTTQFSSDLFRSFLVHGKFLGDVLLFLVLTPLVRPQKPGTERLRLLSSGVIFATLCLHAYSARGTALPSGRSCLSTYTATFCFAVRETSNLQPVVDAQAWHDINQIYPAATASYDLSQKVQLAPQAGACRCLRTVRLLSRKW